MGNAFVSGFMEIIFNKKFFVKYMYIYISGDGFLLHNITSSHEGRVIQRCTTTKTLDRNL